MKFQMNVAIILNPHFRCPWWKGTPQEHGEGKTTQAVETLLASIEEKRILRAKAPCFPFTKREINGDQEGYEQHHSISVVRVERSEPNQSKS
eukprot:scaffold231826_cov18-Tisochrysis_lutea.AAC.1